MGQFCLQVLQILPASYQSSNILSSFIHRSWHIRPIWHINTNRLCLNPLLSLKSTPGEWASCSLLGSGVITWAVLEMVVKEIFRCTCHNLKTDHNVHTLSVLCHCWFIMKPNTFIWETFAFLSAIWKHKDWICKTIISTCSVIQVWKFVSECLRMVLMGLLGFKRERLTGGWRK
jgi:hypothetical protein